MSSTPPEQIEKSILFIRGCRVMLDSDLARLYGVPTRRLNEQVRRNEKRFPTDFMFQLSQEEYENLKSQIATSSFGHGGRRKLPLVFTEHGAVMQAVFDAIRQLMLPPDPPRRRIGINQD